MAKDLEKEAEFKSALRRLILSRSNLIKKELGRGTRFIYSEQYPTQVLNTTLGRFIRVNSADINEDNIDNLLKIMMSIDKFIKLPEREVVDETGATIVLPEESMDLAETLTKANEICKQKEYLDLNMSGEFTDEIDEDDYNFLRYDGNIFTYDSFHNITGLDGINLEPQLIHLKSTLEEAEEFDPSKVDIQDKSLDEDTSATDMTESCEALSKASDSDGVGTPADKSKTPTNVLIEQALTDLPQYKGISKFHSNSSILTKDDLIKLQPKIKQLLKAFQGAGGTIKTSVPTKKISAKDVATDRDRCYVKKTAVQGKHIKMNLLIDMSGSMSGSPVKNAVRLVYLFNQLAKQGYVTMSVLYSTTNSNFKVQLPISDAEVLSLCQTQSAEGLAKTIHAHAEAIRGINTICITDGDIVDEPIDKLFWAKHKSISTGVYVNSSLTSYTEYSGKLNQWFNHSVVRKSLDELIEWLIRVGLRG